MRGSHISQNLPIYIIPLFLIIMNVDQRIIRKVRRIGGSRLIALPPNFEKDSEYFLLSWKDGVLKITGVKVKGR